VREIEKVYYDPFETDDYKISKNLDKVENLVIAKQNHLQDRMEEIYKKNEAIRSIAVDLAYLRKTKERLATENDTLNKKIKSL
jgi:hypothetical protein